MNENIRTEIIEVQVAVGTMEYSLGRLPNISQAKKIISIEAFNATQITTSPTSRPVLNAAAFNAAYLKLITGQSVELRTLPLAAISKTVNGAVIPVLDLVAIDPEKSKVVFGANGSLVAGQVVLLLFTYEK